MTELSYVLAPDGSSIMCARCGTISYNANDVRAHYCSICHRFHNDVEVIEFYLIYDHPSDYPDSFVLRRHMNVFVLGQPPVEVAENACHVASLDELHAFIPKDAVRIGPQDEDDPVIAEVWMR
jgi:hypothetical protein